MTSQTTIDPLLASALAGAADFVLRDDAYGPIVAFPAIPFRVVRRLAHRDRALADAADFVGQVTGTEPTPAELADALKRYFVLNEIKEHILMLRSGATEILE